MGRMRLFTVAVFVYLIVFSSGRELKLKREHELDDQLPKYNHTLAKILVEYASAVYVSNLTELLAWTCSRCGDLIEGFEIIELIVDVQHCLQAFVGVAKDLNSIVIAFRGTQEVSIQNWIEDLFWKQLDLNYPNMPDAMVHHGFYAAYHNTTMRPAIIRAVNKAKAYYGELGIMVTGHSLGGAMAAFCGLDLTVNLKAKNVSVMTFGQPRIGNAVFVSYYFQLVPNTFRITHEHDMVPHLPPYYSYFPSKTYHHFPREVWIHNGGLRSLLYLQEKVCDGSGEDPECSRSVRGNSIMDHLAYFGVELMGDDWRTCGVAMSSELKEFGKADVNGNLVLSRNLSSPIIKLKTEAEGGSKID